MKKLITLCVCAVMSISLLLGCTDNSQPSATDDTPQTSGTQQQEPTTPEPDSPPATSSDEPTPATSERGYKDTTPEVAKQMMTTEEFILLDPRSLQEYQTRRIEGAISIPTEELDARAAAELPDKDALIFVYGRPSQVEPACTKLVELGYTNVHDIGSVMDNGPFPTIAG